MNKNKSIIITGAAKKIGRELSLLVASMGYSVIAHYNSSKDEIENLKKDIQKFNVQCYTVKHDLAKNISSFYDKIDKLDLNVYGLINNASIFDVGNIVKNGDDIENVFKINAFAPLKLSKLFANSKNSGFILNLLDANIYTFNKNFELYRMSKRLLEDFTLECASLFAPNIRVNAIAPGSIFESNGLYSKKPLLKDSGNIEDIKSAFKFLCNAKSVTGQIIYVDGGIHLI